MKNDPFDDWVKQDAYQHQLRIGFLEHDKSISSEQAERLNEMLKSKDDESVELAKLTIETLKTEDERDRTNIGEQI